LHVIVAARRNSSLSLEAAELFTDLTRPLAHADISSRTVQKLLSRASPTTLDDRKMAINPLAA
jgi:hypothetical protein